MNRFLCSFLALSSFMTLRAKAAAGVDADAVQLVAPFAIAATTEVPGKTLKAGSYAIRIVDHLSDRVILEIEDAKGTAQTTFLGLENSSLRGAGRAAGPLAWENGANKTNALRGFTFPGGATVEFVYPKADAVAIAKSNATKVPAIDPASEGKVSAKKLSKEDLQTVTLWTLLSTRVGPEAHSEPAIEAERYQPPVVAAAAGDSRGAGAPPRMPHAAVAFNPAPPLTAAADRPRRAPQSIATNTHLKVLPHTASTEPLIESAALLSLGLATAFRSQRRKRGTL